MISLLGSPQLPLTTDCQNERASPRVKALAVTQLVTSKMRATGIRPAVESLREVLAAAIEAERSLGHDLDAVLGSQGMLCARFRKPTSGVPSTKVSNHAWGTAIDLNVVGHDAPGNTHDAIPRFIAALLPFFNRGGWYSGIGFSDTMHFEVADGTIHAWAKDGKLAP